jgi:hypothetical protein
MPTFIAGSTHKLTVPLRFKPDAVRFITGEPAPVKLHLTLYLEGKKGKMVSNPPTVSIVNLTKEYQDFTFSMVMPSTPGKYRLVVKTSPGGVVEDESDETLKSRQITIKQ